MKSASDWFSGQRCSVVFRLFLGGVLGCGCLSPGSMGLVHWVSFIRSPVLGPLDTWSSFRCHGSFLGLVPFTVHRLNVVCLAVKPYWVLLLLAGAIVYLVNTTWRKFIAQSPRKRRVIYWKFKLTFTVRMLHMKKTKPAAFTETALSLRKLEQSVVESLWYGVVYKTLCRRTAEGNLTCHLTECSAELKSDIEWFLISFFRAENVHGL